MKIAILGGAGFIGSSMIKFLKERDHKVRAVGRSFNRPERARLYKYADQIVSADLRDFNSCLLAVSDVDYVISLTANMGGVSFFHDHNYYPFLDNMQMDINMLRACKLMGVKRVFYASSACIYPTHLQMVEGKATKLSEDMILPANSDQMYGWEKLMITLLSKEAPLDIRVGIFHTIFGPYQEIKGERMKFPTAIATKALQAQKDGKPIEIWGNGKQMRSFLYIDDALEKIYRVLTNDTYEGAVNIGSDVAYTVTEIAELCCFVLGIEPNFTYTDAKPSGVLARNCDNTKFEKLYNYKNQVSTIEGFKRLIEWIQEQ